MLLLPPNESTRNKCLQFATFAGLTKVRYEMHHRSMRCNPGRISLMNLSLIPNIRIGGLPNWLPPTLAKGHSPAGYWTKERGE